MAPNLLTIPLALICAASGAWGAVYYATYAVRSQLLGRARWRGRAETNGVALTFDDGPSDQTLEVLDVLKTYEARAAFFMIGREVERRPDLAREVMARGHEIGNHSYSHPIYLYCGAHRTRWELERAQETIFAATGILPKFARPPCGVRTPAYFRAARELGLETIQWTVAGFDWKKKDATEIARAVLHRLEPGAIILLHDGDSSGKSDRRATVAALPLIIEGALSRGLRFTSLEELLTG